MPQTYPFTRASGTDFAAGHVFQPAEASTIDKNAAQAADGLAWSDLAACRLMPYSLSLTGAKVAVQGFNNSTTPYLKWVVVGTSDVIRRSLGGMVWDGTTDAAIMTTPLWAASNGLGIVIGGDNGASAAKYAYSTTGTDAALSSANSTDNTAATSNSGVWIAGSVNLFVAGLSDGDIETSPTGQTWTARTAPNANARLRLETNGTNLVAATSSASTDKYITSADAVTWTERSFPTSSSSGYEIAYSAYESLWFASNRQTAALYKSSDCISWSSVTTNWTVRGRMLAVGRVLIMNATNQGNGVLMASVDEGTTWVELIGVESTAAPTCLARGLYNNQFAVVGNDVARLSARIADPTQATSYP